MKSPITEVKKKKELSQLPNSIVQRALNTHKQDIKATRAYLRKYFGVFLTNKIIKGKGTAEELLNTHLSSKKRNYQELYQEIFTEKKSWKTLIDFGCAVNGLSLDLLHQHNIHAYLGIEASGQIVNLMNDYFKDEHYDNNADVYHLDLFDTKETLKLIEGTSTPRIAFLFQLIDALESLQHNYSKTFILAIAPYFETLIISLPTESLGGKKKFNVNRTWLTNFLQEHFTIQKDFEQNGERFLIIKHKKT